MKRETRSVVKCVFAVVAVVAVILGMNIPSLAENRPQPTSLLLSADGTIAWVAHRQPGGIAVVHLASSEVQWWSHDDQRLRDLTAVDEQSALALVEDPPSLVRLDRRSAQPEVKGRWPGTGSADRVHVAADGKMIAITSQADRWVKFMATDKLSDSEPGWQIVELQFSPGESIWMPDHRHLLIADAFGGKLSLIDSAEPRLINLRQIPAHNISGLALGSDGRQLFITHQILHQGSQTTFDDIHWGALLTNVLRRLDVKDVLEPGANLLAHATVTQLGGADHGAGDPAGIAIRSNGTAVIALAGTNELMYQLVSNDLPTRVSLGARPSRVILSSDHRRAIVLNELDDSLSLVSLNLPQAAVQTISLREHSTLSAVDRGERLFFNARLSHDGWFSCHSCHTNGHTNGNLVDNLTDGSMDTPKRVLTLRGIRDTAPYGWDGHLPTLADQVRHSITSTMQGNEPTESDVSDLVAYLESLPTWPKPATVSDGMARGRAVFERENCIRCHSTETYTTPETYDVGLMDERGRTRFNPPSLRGVRQGGPYFHDGRATTLNDVVSKFRHQLREDLSAEDEASLIEFLKSL